MAAGEIESKRPKLNDNGIQNALENSNGQMKLSNEPTTPSNHDEEEDDSSRSILSIPPLIFPANWKASTYSAIKCWGFFRIK